MHVAIKIDPRVADDKRAVYWNEELSHHIYESDVQQALQEARTNAWKSSTTDGTALGVQLYEMLNGSGGQLSAAVKEVSQKGEPLHLYLDIPFAIDALPVELLHRQRFLALESDCHLIRRVTDRNRLQDVRPERRLLKLLFMACSPTNLADAVLQFEQEEERILQEVEKFPVDMRIEDSGSLQGLADALYEGAGYDIVHITGHAGIDPTLGPVFYMENDLGELEKATPDTLWERLEAFRPKLLFLSGCSTAKSDKLNASESFAHLMVQKGIPIVLGWGLPVSDTGATALTAELYRYLAMGKGIDEAVQHARLALQDRYHPWPLLRVFTDGSRLTPLITAGQRLRQRTARTTTHKTLADGQVRVLEKGFVGRRREMQTGVRILKGFGDTYGLLIRGPAGVGKSCLAGKLLERCADKELIVIRGEVKKVDVLQKLRHMFDRQGIASGLDIIKSEMEFDDKIKALFRGPFQEQPTVLYFDDFEQNLVRHGDEYHVTEEAIEIMKPLLTAVDWAEGKTNLMITSRHPFVLESEGQNLPAEKLEDLSLMSFNGPDLEKKKHVFRHIPTSAHSELYMAFGKGNPRLLEWLEKIAAEETKYDLEALQEALQGTAEEYIQQYVAEIMAKTQGEDFLHFLHQAAVFRQPVEKGAFAMFGNAALLEKGVDLTLIEREQRRGREAVYWVAPIIRDSEWARLSAEEQGAMHQLAYHWYDATIEGSPAPDYQYMEEAVHHALESGDIRGACRHVIPLGNHLADLLLYREQLHVQQRVIDHITDAVIEEAIRENDDRIAGLLNNQGYTWDTLGEARRAIEYFEQALAINRQVFGDVHPDVARDYNNLGAAWADLGEARRAIEYFEQALAIDRQVFGDTHPDVALRYNNLGEAWRQLGEARRAIEYFEQALAINRQVFGDVHPSVARNYNNLGEAWRQLGEARRAIEYFEQALAIDRQVFGDTHPDVARDYNNLGAAWADLGEARRAIEYFEQALAIDRQVFGDTHPDVALRYNNLGAAWADLGEARRAIEYHEQALAIDRQVFGDTHPDVARGYNNLGVAWGQLGEARQARAYLEKALEIYTAVYGNDHPSTRTVKENLETL